MTNTKLFINVGIADLTFGNSKEFLDILKAMGLHIEYVGVDDHKVQICLFGANGRRYDLFENYYISDKMTKERVLDICEGYVASFICLMERVVKVYEDKKKGGE